MIPYFLTIEDTYDIEIQDEELQTVKNMGDFIAYIEGRIAEKK